MKGKLIAFAFAVFGVATIGIVQLQTKALDSSRDQDQYAVVWNGTLSGQELRNAYDNGRQKSPNIPKIFSAMGIGRAALNGAYVNGIVHTNGNVTVNGKTVATGARTAARNLGGTKIAGTNAGIVPTRAMGDDQTAMVRLDSNGQFKFAVMKPCGNPVKANPTAPPKPQPKPSAICKTLKIEKLSRTSYRFDADANVANGATIRSYTYVVKRNGTTVFTKTQTSDLLTYNAPSNGSYTVSVRINTSVGVKTDADCVQSFEVEKPEKQTPGIKVTKHVENKKYARVALDTEFSYQIAVTNTGDTDLADVEVTDTPEEGVTLTSAEDGDIENNTWTHTIASLMKGETQNFTLNAKVPNYLTGKLTNTVCVDAPTVPGSPDDCDDADVDVPPQGKTQVCDPDTGKIITVNENEADNYEPVESEACQDVAEPLPTEVAPSELPQTGPAETLLQLVGAVSLAGSSAYYVSSFRRS